MNLFYPVSGLGSPPCVRRFRGATRIKLPFYAKKTAPTAAPSSTRARAPFSRIWSAGYDSGQCGHAVGTVERSRTSNPRLFRAAARARSRSISHRRPDETEICRDFERRRTSKRRGARATGQRGHLFRCPERRQLRPADQGGASGGVKRTCILSRRFPVSIVPPPRVAHRRRG